MKHPPLDRRSFLRIMGLGAAGCLVQSQWSPRLLHAADLDDAPFLIFASFDGGWDQLLALDPRHHGLFGGTSGGIQTGYDVIAASDATTDALLSSGDGSGIVQPQDSNIAFGPAIGDLANLASDLCVVRGLNMGTLTHEVGSLYLNTGKFPRGLQANGSSLLTSVTAQYEGLGKVVPNLSVGVRSFNEGLPSFATGLKINSHADLRAVMVAMDKIATETGKAPPFELRASSASAIDEYAWSTHCSNQRLDGDGQVTEYFDSREAAVVLSSGEYFEHFNFIPNPEPTSAMGQLYAHFGVSGATGNITQVLEGPTGNAMVAAQAITQGISQCVSVELASQLDHHDDDWETDHAPRLREGFNALERLITFLKAMPYKDGTYWDHSVLLCGSEFARTPVINGRGGRDHHLASSCLVAGRGIRGNTVIGATDDDTMGVLPVNPETGAVGETNGILIRPADVHATLLEAAGVDYGHLSNQDPVVLNAMLKA
jgi:hypothetical protein